MAAASIAAPAAAISSSLNVSVLFMVILVLHQPLLQSRRFRTLYHNPKVWQKILGDALVPDNIDNAGYDNAAKQTWHQPVDVKPTTIYGYIQPTLTIGSIPTMCRR
jgi:hypothetical protein